MSRTLRNRLTLAAAVLMCSGVLSLSAHAQNDNNGPPPPPPDGQQGPPPQGPGGPDGAGGPPRGGPEGRLAMMQQQLNLTPEQTSRVKDILAAERAQMKVLRDDTSMSPDDRRSKSMKLMHEQNEQIKAVLTPAQKAQFEEMQKQQRERMRDGGPNGGGTPPPPPPQD